MCTCTCMHYSTNQSTLTASLCFALNHVYILYICCTCIHVCVLEMTTQGNEIGFFYCFPLSCLEFSHVMCVYMYKCLSPSCEHTCSRGPCMYMCTISSFISVLLLGLLHIIQIYMYMYIHVHVHVPGQDDIIILSVMSVCMCNVLLF